LPEAVEQANGQDEAESKLIGQWVNCHIYSPFLEGSGLLDRG